MSKNKIDITVTKLRPDAILPAYASDLRIGADICAVDACGIYPGCDALIHTGIALAIPENYEAQIRPNSVLAREHHITVLNTPGTIDGEGSELCVILINHGRQEFCVTAGMIVAQLIISPVMSAMFEE